MSWRWKIAQAAEIRWWKNYLRSKEPTDYLAKKKQYWKRVLDQLNLEIGASSTILDAGCGPAGIFILLDKQDIDAVDPLLDQYAKELPHFVPLDYPNTQFFCDSLETWKPPKQYDYVFCLNAINHVADLELSLNKICDAVRPGGTLIVSVDAHNHALLKPIFQWIPGDILHPHQYDLNEYRQMLKQRGAQITQEHCLKKAFFFNYYVFTAILP